MEEVALKDLDPRLQKQIENARKAVDKNPSYAVDIMSNIVARQPACLDARKILRQAQQRATEGKTKGFGGFLSKMTSIPFSIGSDAKIKKDPEAAMVSAEEMLNANPSNVKAHQVIGSAAEALQLFETAAFVYEEVRKIEPKNAENIKALMSAYIHIGKSEEAIRIGDAAYHEHPADDEIQSLIKRHRLSSPLIRANGKRTKAFVTSLRTKKKRRNSSRQVVRRPVTLGFVR